MKKHWWLFSAVAVFFFISGILLDKWIKNWAFISLKAFWVTIILEKRTSDERTQKDIIIRHTELLFLILEDLRVKVRDGRIDYLLAASWIKRLSVNTSSIVVELVKASITDGINHEALIKTELSTLKDLMTNTVANDPDLSVHQGVITISEPRRVLIEGQLDKVRNEFFKFELSINKG
jgi:hypothetical protein